MNQIEDKEDDDDDDDNDNNNNGFIGMVVAIRTYMIMKGHLFLLSTERERERELMMFVLPL